MSAKRNLNIEEAEIELKKLQIEKIRNEIKMNKPFWIGIHKFSALAPFLTALITAGILWKSNFFDVNKIDLQNKVHDLNDSINAFSQTKEKLITDNIRLTDNKNKLQIQTDSLKTDNIRLTNSKNKLQTQIDSLRKAADKLEKNLDIERGKSQYFEESNSNLQREALMAQYDSSKTVEGLKRDVDIKEHNYHILDSVIHALESKYDFNKDFKQMLR